MTIRAFSRLRKVIFGKPGTAGRKNVATSGKRSHYLPPHLPKTPAKESLLPDEHLLANLPCTRYWHHERNAEIEGKKPAGIPHWLRRFDWLVGWEHGWADAAAFPQHVFCHPDALAGLLAFLQGSFDERRSGAFLVVAGEDTRLSQQDPAVMAGLLGYFDKIFYEAYDQEFDGVDIMPIGLTEFYIRGVEERARLAIHGEKSKSSLLISAFGEFWPHLNQKIDDRRTANEFARTAGGFVTVGPFPREDYFDALARHSFMICPRGNGVQTPKWLEASLVECVPILTDSLMARTIMRKGAPILVVDKWSDISEAMLRRKIPEFAERAKEFSAIAQDLDAWWNFSFDG